MNGYEEEFKFLMTQLELWMIMERYSPEHQKNRRKEYEEKFRKNPEDAYYSLRYFLDALNAGKKRESERVETERRAVEERENLTEAIAEGLKRYELWKRSRGF